jgi:hypothetical protein
VHSLLKKAPFELKDIDLNEVAQDTVKFLSALAIARRVELACVIAETPLPIKGDQVQAPAGYPEFDRQRHGRDVRLAGH